MTPSFEALTKGVVLSVRNHEIIRSNSIQSKIRKGIKLTLFLRWIL